MTSTKMTETIGSPIISTFLFIFMLTFPFTTVDANADGSPTCIPDTSAPGVDHKTTGYEERNIAAGRIKIMIGTEELVPDKVMAVTVGVPYQVTLTKATPFKGLMARIGGQDPLYDTSGVIELIPGDETLKYNQLCSSWVSAPTTNVDKQD